MRGVHAAILAVAGHKGAAVDGSKPAHHDWLVVQCNLDYPDPFGLDAHGDTE